MQSRKESRFCQAVDWSPTVPLLTLADAVNGIIACLPYPTPTGIPYLVYIPIFLCAPHFCHKDKPMSTNRCSCSCQPPDRYH
ncbi:unnamed protein product [Cylicostephanus goldi]|uniref:Uncharacterized protein n=1 Tax=Cylicostephanus goldi TaxID=71465 RepID=A0A3P6SYK2_CYLGO|nr:unnamed protein product [Cylicostephanus goldi]